MAKFLTLACSAVFIFAVVGPGRTADTKTQIMVEAISVPRGASPTIDGTIGTDEWQGAQREFFSDRSELLLLRNGSSFYLGIRAATPDMIGGNVFIEYSDGIVIHHVSAALGTAIYRKDGEEWRLARNFSWRCRGAGIGKEAEAERESFLREEGWIASTSYMGTPQELEYRIRTGVSPIRIAVVFLRASDPNVRIPWPAGLDDDSIKPNPKGLPPTLRFSPEKWATIALNQTASIARIPTKPEPKS